MGTYRHSRSSGSGRSGAVRALLVLLLVAGLLPWAVGTASAAGTTTVTITADRPRAVAGTPINLTINVTNGNNGTLTITTAPAGGTPRTDGISNSVNEGPYSWLSYPPVNTLFTATLNGVSASVEVRIRPLIGTVVRSPHAQINRYAVMARGTQPLFRSQSAPARPGEMCLSHEVQRLRSGVWRTVATSGCRLEGYRGLVSWTWRGTHPHGVGFRVRARFPGDGRNIAGPGGWTYFRFR